LRQDLVSLLACMCCPTPPANRPSLTSTGPCPSRRPAVPTELGPHLQRRRGRQRATRTSRPPTADAAAAGPFALPCCSWLGSGFLPDGKEETTETAAGWLGRGTGAPSGEGWPADPLGRMEQARVGRRSRKREMSECLDAQHTRTQPQPNPSSAVVARAHMARVP
jgi:hypothetical protein